MKIEKITFDPTDLYAMRKLMREQSRDTPYCGENEQGERIILGIRPDLITLTTYQSNRWIRTNTYWADGSSEETYER